MCQASDQTQSQVSHKFLIQLLRLGTKMSLTSLLQKVESIEYVRKLASIGGSLDGLGWQVDLGKGGARRAGECKGGQKSGREGKIM